MAATLVGGQSIEEKLNALFGSGVEDVYEGE